MNERARKAQDCLKAAKLLYSRFLVNAYEGNVSVRLGDTILVTPSAVCKEELEEDDLVEVDIASGATVAAKPGRVASSETKMHLCVYRNRADVQGVAHAHPPFATAYAVAGMPIETAAYAEMRVLYDRIPVCRYGRPGTEAVNADVPEALASLAARMRAELPALPMTTENGARVLLPCETRIDAKTRNVENPELYAVFPFPLFGLGRADLQVARDTFERRRFRHGFGWCQDAIQAARLGLTDTVKNILVKAARMKDERAIFPAFFGPNFDETPDQDHGSNLCLALIYMLLQSDGTNALPFPAWPESWNARFRLPICAGRWICGECVDGQKTVREEGTLAGV